MPKTLNPNNNFPTSITNFPISGNNEPIAIEPLEAAIQAVLDRTENLHQSRLTVEGVGVKRIRQFASRSALSAASGFADGDIVSVDGYGLYRLFVSSSAAVDGLWVLSATGGGRWIHIENDLKGANGGLATLDSGGRLSQDVRDGSIVTAHLANGSVTAAKLASGAAVANIGYTPVNKAGDTITGNLTVSGMATLAGRTFRKVSFVPTSGVGWYRIIANTNVFGGRLDIHAEWNSQVSRITLEGHSGGYTAIGYFNATQVYHYADALITQIRWGQSGGADAYLDIYVANVTNNNNTPINLYFWGDAWNGIQTSPAFNPAAGTTNMTLNLSSSNGGLAVQGGVGVPTWLSNTDGFALGWNMSNGHGEINLVSSANGPSTGFQNIAKFKKYGQNWDAFHIGSDGVMAGTPGAKRGAVGLAPPGDGAWTWIYNQGSNLTIGHGGDPNNLNPIAIFYSDGQVNIPGNLSARYDHQNRFVVSAFAGQDIAVSGNSFTVLGRIFVTVPSGRSLYVRRVRAYFTGDFRARVAAMTGSVWVAGQAALDADINQSILTGPVSGLVYVGADNVSGSSQTVQKGHGAMIELEIR